MFFSIRLLNFRAGYLFLIYCLAVKVSQQVSLQQFAVQLPTFIIPALQESFSV